MTDFTNIKMHALTAHAEAGKASASMPTGTLEALMNDWDFGLLTGDITSDDDYGSVA